MHSDRLKWLRIHAYRNVAPGTFLEFGSGFNVLLGRNGTGKTTLLELVDMIWAKGFAEVADEAFHLEYAVEYDGMPHDHPLQRPADRAVPGCTFEVMVKNELGSAGRSGRGGTSPHFSYRVAVKARDGEIALEIEGTPVGATLRHRGRSEAVEVLGPHSGPIVWAAPRQLFDVTGLEPSELESDAARWAHWASLFFELNIDAGRFDESLGAFHALTSEEYQAAGSGVRGVRWEVSRRLDREAKVYPLNEQACAFMPADLLDEWIKELGQDVGREPPVFQKSLREHPILGAFVELTTYSDMIVEFRHHERKRAPLGDTLTFRTPDLTFMLPRGGGDIKASALSYGEKRLLSFLWYLACNPSLIIADELVNGFHHEWITRCVELIGARQAFLTSQNPLLLDCLPLADVEYVRRCFITCHRGPETEGQMRWSNLTQEEAERFYRAYERETQYVHEILRGQGLW